MRRRHRFAAASSGRASVSDSASPAADGRAAPSGRRLPGRRQCRLTLPAVDGGARCRRSHPDRVTCSTAASHRGLCAVMISPGPTDVDGSVTVWFPDWPVVAAGFAPDVPAAVMAANRVVARTAGSGGRGGGRRAATAPGPGALSPHRAGRQRPRPRRSRVRAGHPGRGRTVTTSRRDRAGLDRLRRPRTVALLRWRRCGPRRVDWPSPSCRVAPASASPTVGSRQASPPDSRSASPRPVLVATGESARVLCTAADRMVAGTGGGAAGTDRSLRPAGSAPTRRSGRPPGQRRVRPLRSPGCPRPSTGDGCRRAAIEHDRSCSGTSSRPGARRSAGAGRRGGVRRQAVGRRTRPSRSPRKGGSARGSSCCSRPSTVNVRERSLVPVGRAVGGGDGRSCALAARRLGRSAARERSGDHRRDRPRFG